MRAVNNDPYQCRDVSCRYVTVREQCDWGWGRWRGRGAEGGGLGEGGYKGGKTKNKVPAYEAVSLALNTTLQYADRLSDSSAMPPLQAGPLASHAPTNLRF